MIKKIAFIVFIIFIAMLIIGCLMGVETLLYVFFPLSILLLQIGVCIYLITFISRYFMRKIKRQNKQFRIELKKEKELLGKVAK